MIGRARPAALFVSFTAIGWGMLGCGASQAPAADGYDSSALLNPKHSDGRPVFLDFDHHPECFVLGEGGNTESVECPEDAVRLLEDCRGGRLYVAKEGEGCICAPVSGDETSRVKCEVPVP